MLDKNRIACMSKMAISEKGSGKRAIKTCQYFKWDYVSKNILIGILWILLIYLVSVATIAVIDLENTLTMILNNELSGFLTSIAIGALILSFISAFVFYFIYAYQYKLAKIQSKKYFTELKKINRLYMKEPTDEGNL